MHESYDYEMNILIIKHERSVGVGVCSKQYYSYLFSTRWKFMSKIAIRQL